MSAYCVPGFVIVMRKGVMAGTDKAQVLYGAGSLDKAIKKILIK